MERQIALKPSLVFMRRLAKDRWLRKSAPGYAFWISVPLLALIFCLVSGEIPILGAGGALLGILIGVIAILIFSCIYSYVKTQEAIMKVFQKWSDNEVTYTFNDDGISVDSELSSGCYKWKMIGTAELTLQALMLFSSEQHYIALPIELLHDGLQQFILQKVVESGGKVTR